MSSFQRVLCGVPKEYCSGSGIAANTGLQKYVIAHGTHEQAFKCMKKYLLKMGYTQIGSKEFRPPNGGPIRVLTRPGKFGGALRMGKNQEGKGHRVVPNTIGRSVKSGLIYTN